MNSIISVKVIPVISSSSVSHGGHDSSAALSAFIGGVSSEETQSSISLPPAKYQEVLLGMTQLLRNSAWKTPASVQVSGLIYLRIYHLSPLTSSRRRNVRSPPPAFISRLSSFHIKPLRCLCGGGGPRRGRPPWGLSPRTHP